MIGKRTKALAKDVAGQRGRATVSRRCGGRLAESARRVCVTDDGRGQQAFVNKSPSRLRSTDSMPPWLTLLRAEHRRLRPFSRYDRCVHRCELWMISMKSSAPPTPQEAVHELPFSLETNGLTQCAPPLLLAGRFVGQSLDVFP